MFISTIETNIFFHDFGENKKSVQNFGVGLGSGKTKFANVKKLIWKYTKALKVSLINVNLLSDSNSTTRPDTIYLHIIPDQNKKNKIFA